MKVLFLTDDLRVKHYHMAAALKDMGVAEPNLLHMKPTFFDIKAIAKFFPYPNRAWYYARANTTKFVRDLKGDDVFSTHARYSKKRLRALNPDVIYVNKLAAIELIEEAGIKAKIVLDVEDSALINKDIFDNQKAIEWELKAMNHEMVDTILFGSHSEMVQTIKAYDSIISKDLRVQYPFVAKRTCVPAGFKTKEFSLVFAGSLWSGGEYRDGFKLLEEIAQTGILIDVFLLNSWSSHNWKLLKDLSRKYSNLGAFKRTKIQDLKKHINKYHAGLCLSAGNYMKVAATWGMKPLEYAYADVVPVAISIDKYDPFGICNLSDCKEFGYIAKADTIQKDFCIRLHDFDWDYHIMDNHVDKFSELM